jgi:hypothetical protein
MEFLEVHVSSRILIAGGYGLVGARIAAHLRKVGYQGELLLGGRHPVNGKQLAEQLGHARSVHLEVGHPLPALREFGRIDLIIAALRDPYDALINVAIRQGAAYIGITKTADDTAPVMFLLNRRGAKGPIVVLGHWQAGVMTLVARKAVQRFRHIDSVSMAALYDVKDPVGPMTARDSDSFISRALVRRSGEWAWIDARTNVRRVERENQDAFDAMPMGVLDVPSMASITGAANVRFDVGVGESFGTRAGKKASHDLYIDIAGVLNSGEPSTLRTVLSDPNGQAHLTSLGVVLATEHVLGLNQRTQADGGLCLPESIVDIDAGMARLVEFGVEITEQP